MTKKNPLILVVDDEDIVCVSVRRILSREGHEVDMVMSADDALAMMRDKEYDLVITDLMMPEMNGIELMHAIRKRNQDLPFLMITGYPTIRTAMQALRLGAIDYIPKPFTRAELLGPVNRALRRREFSDTEAGQAEKETPKTLNPGDRYILPEHSWAVYEQDGTLMVGIEASFLESAGTIEKIEPPIQNEMIEQGYPMLKVLTDDGGQHNVFSPFSGRVAAVNSESLPPNQVSANEWIIRMIPSSLQAETAMLVKTHNSVN